MLLCAILIGSALCPLTSALADLTITGTPGFTFSDSPAGRPSVANLNRALRFTYQVSGTVGGTNAGIAAGSITPVMFAASVAGSNLVLTTSGLVISNNGVTPFSLSPAVAGSGLSGGGGTALSVNVDTNTIAYSGGDTITLAPAAVSPTNVYYATGALTPGSNVTVDWSTHFTFTLTLTNNSTLAFTGGTDGQTVTLAVTQSSFGTNTLTWPTVKWRGGSAPTLTTTAGRTDIFSILKLGTNYYGSASQNHY